MSTEQAELPFGDTSDAAVSSNSGAPVHPAAPDTPPEELVAKPLPRVDGREEIAPDDEACTVQAGDLLVSHVGTSAMEWYGLLILDTYGTNTLIGLALPAYQYGDRELSKWVEWLGEHADADHTTVYKNVAPQTESADA